MCAFCALEALNDTKSLAVLSCFILHLSDDLLGYHSIFKCKQKKKKRSY